MNILSIQSHVSYGYVGNKAATFPLQSLGFDVWPINTVQFSNHTGYGSWKGDVFSAQHIDSIIRGIEAINLAQKCDAILSGYIGDKTIGQVIINAVKRFKILNPSLYYLLDPVMGTPGGKGCVVKQDIPLFFRQRCLDVADIITPNHFEAEILWGKKINVIQELQQASAFFHNKGVSIVAITRLQLRNLANSENYLAYLSIQNNQQWIATAPVLELAKTINGSGDLFSALYLGHFLLTKDPVLAFKQAMNTTYKILMSTVTSNRRELEVIRNNYCDPAPNTITLIPLKQQGSFDEGL